MELTLRLDTQCSFGPAYKMEPLRFQVIGLPRGDETFIEEDRDTGEWVISRTHPGAFGRRITRGRHPDLKFLLYCLQKEIEEQTHPVAV